MPRYNREKTLERAVFAFWQHGYAECSVKNLEQDTGLHTGSLYYHFKNKEQLYKESVTFYLQSMLLPKLFSVTSMDDLQHFFYALYRKRSGLIKNTCFLIQAVSDVAGHTIVNQAFKRELIDFETAFTSKVNALLPGCSEVTTLLMDLYLALYIYSEQSAGRNVLDHKIRERFDLVKKLCPVS